MASTREHPAPSRALPALARRPRERVAGALLQVTTRVVGMKPAMVPEHFRRQLRLLGATDAQVGRVLPKLRSLAEWPYGWEAEGDACAAAGDWTGAYAAYYAAQRILIAPSPLKHRLYDLAVAAYARVEQPKLERPEAVSPRGERIGVYLQMPAGAIATRPVPCVLMVPGITGTKEELHAYAMPILERGIAVARIDNPVYGETEGLLDAGSVRNATTVLDILARDPRLDARALHLHGMSLGANFALQSAHGSRAASLTLICPPYLPARYLRGLPTLNLTALQHMTHAPDIEEIVAFAEENALDRVAPSLTMPVRIFHGGRDRTIPVTDGQALAEAVGGPVALTVYERDHHNCLEHMHEITAQTLEFLRDPAGTCLRHAALQRIDVPAGTHATDEDAMLARAGHRPRRLRVRLPFHVPSVSSIRAIRSMRSGTDAPAFSEP